MSFRLKCHHDDVQVLLCFYISQFVYDQSISWSHFHLFFIRLEINVCRPDQLFLWVNFDGWRPSLWRNVVASSLTLMQFLYPIMLKHSIKRLFVDIFNFTSWYLEYKYTHPFSNQVEKDFEFAGSKTYLRLASDLMTTA